MSNFSAALNKVSGLRFIYDSMELYTSIGRKQLLMQPYLVQTNEIEFQINKIASFLELITDTRTFSIVNDLKHTLSEVHDISGTLNLLEAGIVLDDIGLFEVKKFAILVFRINKILNDLKFGEIVLADTATVIDILDPENQRIPHFWIHDLYSSELAKARHEYSKLVKIDPPASEIIRLKSVEIEDEIRVNLSAELKKHAPELLQSVLKIGQIDVWLAKATLALKLNLYKPTITTRTTCYSGIFHPQVASTLELKGKYFQALDINIEESPCLITGANMAGKTVLLKTVALTQYLFQYGFFVPASSAQIAPVEMIITSMSDDQSELKGLSSFAAEMLNINTIISSAKAGKKILALIDEPAKTTNPAEGLSLVNALVELLLIYQVRSLITTHYSGLKINCRRLRVKGLKIGELTGKPTIETINDYMDYSLIEVISEEVPMEALKIASILKVDEELIDRATKYLEKNRNNNN